eukprot:COSAG06_NODE_66407_length_254_cov_0.980645_2_plen_51_part_01
MGLVVILLLLQRLALFLAELMGPLFLVLIMLLDFTLISLFVLVTEIAYPDL